MEMSRGFVFPETKEVRVMIMEGDFKIEVARRVRKITKRNGPIETANYVNISDERGCDKVHLRRNNFLPCCNRPGSRWRHGKG
jgi:hypothetical protein